MDPEAGTHKGRNDAAPLSEISEILDDRFGANLTKSDQLFFDQVTESAKADEGIVEKAAANAFDNFALAIDDRLLDLVIERMDKNGEITSKLMNEPEVRRLAFREIAKNIYDTARAKTSADPTPTSP